MLLRARWVLPITSDAIDDGAVLVRDKRLEEVGPFADVAARHAKDPIHDLGPESILFPGLVNAHSHLELTVLRGLIEELEFYPWIRRLVELKTHALRPEEHVAYSLLGAAEALRGGVTCVADCTDTGAPFDALLMTGLRGVVFQEVFAPSRATVGSAMDALSEKLDAMQAMATERVRPGISPHSTYMACPELLRAAAKLAEAREVPLSIHVAESDAEVSFLAEGKGAIADHHRIRGWPIQPRGKTPVEHLSEAGWLELGVPVQLVHLVRARQRDLARLRTAVRGGRKLGVAACPRSNARLGNGLPDVAAWTAADLPWGLGTDSAASVGRCDLFEELRFVHLLLSAARSPQHDALSVLRRATIDAARSLGLDAVIGSLEPGKQADLAAVVLSGTRGASLHDPHAALLALAGPPDVVLTMVGGDVLYDGHRLPTIDEESVLATCRERAESIGRAVSASTARRP